MRKLKQIFLILVLTLVSKTNFATNGDTLTVNPVIFDSITVIHFEIAANDTIWLDIFDLVGHPVKTYFNGTVLPSGSYSLNYNGDTLPNGVYLVRLKINSKILVKKIIKTNSVVGVKEYLKNKINILLYPNPTIETLEIPIDGIKTIIVTDLNGRVMINSLIHSKSISLSNLDNGNYIVTILSETKQVLVTQKIVKTKN